MIMTGSPREITIFSPAKINLHLAVKDKRPDGFHDIESVFLAVDWGDGLVVTSNHSGTDREPSLSATSNNAVPDIKISGTEGLLGEDNIVLKALNLFREKTGFSARLDIKLEKRIPIGGGLGGGSSNAAAVLLTLNKMAGFPLERNDLLLMGAALGSDVPFFLHETTAAWVTGRGECIEPLEIPQVFLVLVNPGFQSNTAAAFNLLDKYRADPNLRFKREPLQIKEKFQIMDLYKFHNDFLDVFDGQEKSAYNEIITSLRQSGALLTSLSGSGSTCFGVFEGEDQALKTAENLRDKWKFVHFCRSFKHN
jgi:4-diphosphocytidyl-2-C-methyl-D-erythritol kinase